jgi:MFS family permease
VKPLLPEGLQLPASRSAPREDALRQEGLGVSAAIQRAFSAVAHAFSSESQRDVFGAGDLGFGLMASLCGVGLILGSLAAPRLLERTTPLRLYAGALALMGVGFLTTAVAPTFAVVLAAVVAGTAANGLACVGRALLVQHAVPAPLRGRVFMLLMGSSNGLMAAGMVGAGAAVALTGGRWIWAGAALAAVGASAAAVALRPRTEGSQIDQGALAAPVTG